MIAGLERPAFSAASARVAKVASTERCRAVVPHWTIAAGVCGSLPAAMSKLEISRSRSTPIKMTRVPGIFAKAP